MKRIRCAIYTCKSSDEGLEQDFNSLDAQFEACSPYILSQASERWNAVSNRYDDGGVSCGTLERPALKRLLKDIASGLIDTVVVYKIDRLTRSLLDFAKLVEAFDKADTSFVSFTQSFNTTSSMGRLSAVSCITQLQKSQQSPGRRQCTLFRVHSGRRAASTHASGWQEFARQWHQSGGQVKSRTRVH